MVHGFELLLESIIEFRATIPETNRVRMTGGLLVSLCD